MALRCPVTPTVYQYQVLDEPFRVDSDRLSLRSLSCACQPCQPAPFPTPAGPVGNASRPGLPKPQASVQSDTPLGRPGCIPWLPAASPPALPLQRVLSSGARTQHSALANKDNAARTEARLHSCDAAGDHVAHRRASVHAAGCSLGRGGPRRGAASRGSITSGPGKQPGKESPTSTPKQ